MAEEAMSLADDIVFSANSCELQCGQNRQRY
jgi:hypothetical protein